MMRCLVLGLALSLAAVAQAQAAGSELTLDQALAAAQAEHPELAVHQAQVDLAGVDLAQAQGLDDLRLGLEGSLRTGRNPLTDDRFEPDHQLRFNLRKPLWDSGRQALREDAARLESEGRLGQLMDARQQRRLDVMQRFFEVLQADLAYTAANEFMAASYVAWDKARDRHSLGEVSGVDLADQEARYQDTLMKRNRALRTSREARARLAAAMNRPGQLPAALKVPDLKTNERHLPDMDGLLALLKSRNPRLQAQNMLVQAAYKRRDAVGVEYAPSLELEAELAAYSRDSYTRDNARAGLNFVWPLYHPGQKDARQAREVAQARLLQAQYDHLLLELGQALLETREEILFLRSTARRVAEAAIHSSELNLERARAEYELEMKTNLGNSMAETQAAALRRQEVEYRLALAWARLEALLGIPPGSPVMVEGKEP